MPRVPVPPKVDAFLARPNPAVVATVRPDGSPHVRMATEDYVPVAADDWYHHVSLLGRVVSIAEDADLHDIDRLALRYTGKPYRKRDRPRFSAWMQPEQWHAWPHPPR